MRRILLFGIMLMVLVIPSPESALAQEPSPSHQDPGSVSKKFDATAVFGLFEGVVDLKLPTGYEDARELLRKLPSGNIPDHLLFVVNRYVELLGAFTNQLDLTETEMSNPSALLQENDEELAGLQLNLAEESLEAAGQNLDKLRRAADNLARQLGVALPLTEGPFSQAYRRFLAMPDQLEQLRIDPERLRRQGLAILQSTVIAFEAPARGLPGKPITISGIVPSADGPDPTQGSIRVLLGATTLGKFTGPIPFQYTVLLPGNTIEGAHALSLEFPTQGRYKRALAKQTILVVRVRPDLEVHAQRLLFFTRMLHISGEVTSAISPVQGAVVDIEVGKRTTTVRTDPQGAFTASIALPLTGLFLGPQDLRVKVVPQEPWHGPVEHEEKVFIIGVANVGLLAMVVGYGAVLLGLARRRQKRRLLAESVVPPAPDAEPGFTPESRHLQALPYGDLMEVGSSRERVLSSYYAAAQALQVRRHVPFRSSFTLRDFLRALQTRIESAFAELTGLAERALYRSRQPGAGEWRRAEELAEQVKKEE